MIAIRKALLFLDFIKFKHTLFALPFAVLSAFLAARGLPQGRQLIWILIAMVGARSAAMAFNRIVDEPFDRENPRTAARHLPRGLIDRKEAWAFTCVSIAVFVLAAFQLNYICFALSPVALALILGYSFSKRFTDLSHIWLGIALAIAPVGAWLAIRARFDWPPIWLALAVVFWTAGFDIIYACQDREFDRRKGLHSIPASFGISPALRLSAVFHFLVLVFLALFAASANLNMISWCTLGGVTILLAYEHAIIRPDDLQRVNTAFFTVNAIISFGMMSAGILDILFFSGA